MKSDEPKYQRQRETQKSIPTVLFHLYELHRLSKIIYDARSLNSVKF